MDSPATQRGRAQIVPKQKDDGDNKIFPAKASRRTPSFSTSSSSSLSSRSSSLGSLYFPDESPLSPATPLKFSGVPFSWETLPGIPKKNIHIKKESSLLKKQLPPPPTATAHPLIISSKKSRFQEFGTWKKDSPENFRKDPFIAALVECSKDDDDDVHDDDDDDDDDQDSSYRSFFINGGAKVTRSISDRFGFTSLYTSCKNTCAVSDSLVYTPRSTRTSYDLIHHHHHHHNHHRRRRRGTC